MSFFTGLMETLCGYALAWGANVAVFTVFLCLTGRFWQRNAAPALRRAGYLVAIYIAFLPQFYKVALPLLSMLHDGFPEAVPAEVGVALCLPVAGQTPLPALRATNWAALAGAVWLLGALICAVARILPRWRFGKWLRANGRPLGRRAAGILQRAEEQQRAVEELSPEERLVARRGLSPCPHPVHDAFVVEGIPGPMCVKGLLAGGPRLLLDREDYDAETLDAIFRHELSHLAPSGQRLWGYEDLLAIFGWWNPAAWLLRRCLRAENELCCDELANRSRTPEQRAAYARALTALAARERAYLPGTAQMASRNDSLLRRRVRAVMQPPPRRRSILVGALFLLLATLCTLCFHPMQSGHAPVTEETLLSYLRSSDGFLAADGLYDAERVERLRSWRDGQARGAQLYLTYADAAALASGRAQLETALTARLGAPQSRTGRETVWQTEDADGNDTTVTLLRYDERTLRLE